MAEVDQVRIVVRLGATIEVGDAYGDSAWAKPGVEASVTFDGKPTAEEIEREWKWLWREQIEPQMEGLVRVLKEHARGLPDPETGRRPHAVLSDLPPGGVYGKD